MEGALKLIKKWGPVYIATPSGDFSVITLDQPLGWVVTCHHPDILTYVNKNEVDFDEIKNNREELIVGLLGRSKRDLDSKIPIIIHIEDKRSNEN